MVQPGDCSGLERERCSLAVWLQELVALLKEEAVGLDVFQRSVAVEVVEEGRAVAPVTEASVLGWPSVRGAFVGYRHLRQLDHPAPQLVAEGAEVGFR